MRTMETVPVVFIAGEFTNAEIWKDWQRYFEDYGFRTHALTWPGKDGTTEALRNDVGTDPKSRLGLTDLLAYLETQLRALPDKPILIGHSTGGLLVQLLLQRGLALAGIAMNSLYQNGFRFWEKDSLMFRLRYLGFVQRRAHTISLDFRDWQRFMVNGLDENAQIQAFYDFSVPESQRLLWDIFFGTEKISFKKPHAPLLFIAGEKDIIASSRLNLRNSGKYSHKESVTHYKEFKGRNHLALCLPGWQDLAGFALRWISQNIINPGGSDSTEKRLPRYDKFLILEGNKP